LYVASSRVGAPDQIRFAVREGDDKVTLKYVTRNVVYKEVLLPSAESCELEPDEGFADVPSTPLPVRASPGFPFELPGGDDFDPADMQYEGLLENFPEEVDWDVEEEPDVTAPVLRPRPRQPEVGQRVGRSCLPARRAVPPPAPATECQPELIGGGQPLSEYELIRDRNIEVKLLQINAYNLSSLKGWLHYIPLYVPRSGMRCGQP